MGELFCLRRCRRIARSGRSKRLGEGPIDAVEPFLSCFLGQSFSFGRKIFRIQWSQSRVKARRRLICEPRIRVAKPRRNRFDARRLFRRRRRNPLARSSGAGAATDGPKLDQAGRSSNAMFLRAKALVRTDRRKFFPASRRNNPKTVWRFVSVGPWGRRPRLIVSAQGAAPILRESLQEASISKRRRQIMTLTPAPIALSRRLEEAQSRRFKGGMMSFSLGCCPSWRRDADKMKASTVHATFRFVFAIRMRFAQWAKHPGRKPAATILAVKATIYGLWQRCDGFAKRPDAPSAIRFGLNRFAGPGLDGSGAGGEGRGGVP